MAKIETHITSEATTARTTSKKTSAPTFKNSSSPQKKQTRDEKVHMRPRPIDIRKPLLVLLPEDLKRLGSQFNDNTDDYNEKEEAEEEEEIESSKRNDDLSINNTDDTTMVETSSVSSVSSPSSSASLSPPPSSFSPSSSSSLSFSPIKDSTVRNSEIRIRKRKKKKKKDSAAERWFQIKKTMTAADYQALLTSDCIWHREGSADELNIKDESSIPVASFREAPSMDPCHMDLDHSDDNDENEEGDDSKCPGNNLKLNNSNQPFVLPSYYIRFEECKTFKNAEQVWERFMATHCLAKRLRRDLNHVSNLIDKTSSVYL
eukprot:gb/GECH01005744.1/.p1 GENE.gb/GECH01005744.1/~~gb/GECH01005744.1/.p1  ORF type:complete len:318 (+),score=98.70 gb/GECH01005744.1/:1-954(+)